MTLTVGRLAETLRGTPVIGTSVARRHAGRRCGITEIGKASPTNAGGAEIVYVASQSPVDGHTYDNMQLPSPTTTGWVGMAEFSTDGEIDRHARG